MALNYDIELLKCIKKELNKALLRNYHLNNIENHTMKTSLKMTCYFSNQVLHPERDVMREDIAVEPLTVTVQ